MHTMIVDFTDKATAKLPSDLDQLCKEWCLDKPKVTFSLTNTFLTH